VVSYLLDRGALINVYESDGSTPLTHAIEAHVTDMALYLLERGMHVCMMYVYLHSDLHTFIYVYIECMYTHS